MQRFCRRVAIIGAGPSGLVAARYLRAHGFDPVIFERSDKLGGQWYADGEASCVWPGMRTNTSRVTTRFSDMDHPAEIGTFPQVPDVHAYLVRYAAAFGLNENLRLKTEVISVSRHPSGTWRVHSHTTGEPARAEYFDRVIVASGRQATPAEPDVPGLARFSGSAGVEHAADYRDWQNYAGKTVLVAGGSISALEIASDLARHGVRVITTTRRQRYVAHKRIGSVPVDQVAINRFSALANESLPREAIAGELKAMIVRSSGHPAAYGALTPAEDVFEAGITLSDHYLDLVAEERIVAKPWMESVEGNLVHFSDGSSAVVDGIIMATGYIVDLPFLDLKTQEVLGLNRGALTTYNRTFHPDLEGFALLGMFPQMGPHFPVLELQARWVAYVWAGLVPAPPQDLMREEIAAQDAGEHGPLGHDMAILFAREAGVEPQLSQWPGLARALLFGPLSPVSFRLSGPDALPGAGWDVMTEAARNGAIGSPVFTQDELERLAALVWIGGHTDLAWFLPTRSEEHDAEALRAA